MYRDVSSCNTYDYGDAVYWDARYIQEGGSFDWYQRYSDLKPFLRHYFPLSSTILMVGCGNAENLQGANGCILQLCQRIWSKMVTRKLLTLIFHRLPLT
ncbi:unnamed protein product [Lathyrus sativus]|nr:unnamed protein product [Lathyrus sativus]